MERQDAEELVEAIRQTSGWHAEEEEEDIWQGGWRVRAWPGAEEDGEDDFYSLHSYAEWRRVVEALAAEAALADSELVSRSLASDDLPF